MGSIIIERSVMNTISELFNFTGENMGVIEVTTSGVSSLPVTISNSRVLANHVCVKAVLSNPSAQTGDWTVTTSAGSAVISGTISGTTDITLYLALKTN